MLWDHVRAVLQLTPDAAEAARVLFAQHTVAFTENRGHFRSAHPLIWGLRVPVGTYKPCLARRLASSRRGLQRSGLCRRNSAVRKTCVHERTLAAATASTASRCLADINGKIITHGCAWQASLAVVENAMYRPAAPHTPDFGQLRAWQIILEAASRAAQRGGGRRAQEGVHCCLAP